MRALLGALAALLLAAPVGGASPLLDGPVPETRECEVCWVVNLVIPILDAARGWAQDPPLQPPESPGDSGGQLQ